MKGAILEQGPETPDAGQKYLFYLHGLIVEVAGIRPKSEEHGYYEYELILDTLAAHGFTVISEARPQGTEIVDYARKIAGQIEGLLAKGVPPRHITVVGASKGGVIGAYVSCLLRHPEINFVLLAGLFEKCLKDEALKVAGRVLSIHDLADSQPITPEKYFARSQGLGTFKAIEVQLGLGHGLIYRPYREWLDPLVEWAG